MKAFLIFILFFLYSTILTQTFNQFVQTSQQCLLNKSNSSDVGLSKINFDNTYPLLYEDCYWWRDSEWKFGTRDTHSYDDNYILTEIIRQGRNDSLWDNIYRWLYSSDLNGNIILELQKKWIDSNWVDEDRTFFTYDTNNNCIEHHHQWADWFHGIDFVDFRRCFYTFDSNNNCIGRISESYVDDNWVNSSRYISYIYDSNGNLTSKILQQWRDTVWVNWAMYTYNYDTNNNMIEEIANDWGGSDWINWAIFYYDYDSNDNMIECLVQVWNTFFWMDANLYKYTYIPLSDINLLGSNIIPNKFTLFQNYPNPFNPNTKIQYTIPKQSEVELKIFDLLGREISTLVNSKQAIGNYEVEFNATNLSSGVYLYKIRAGEFVDTKKMILMK